MTVSSPSPWHLLQLSDVLDREFASALAESVPVIAWQPQRTWNPWRTQANAATHLAGLSIQPFPLLRGYARAPLSLISNSGRTLAGTLARLTPKTRDSPLICTTPFLAPVAEQWDGPVVYWLTDLIAEYGGVRGIDVPALDRRICRAATLVCPNSERLRDYLLQQGCDPARIVIVPNATRASNLLPAPPTQPAPLPAVVQHLPRPVAGVIGNLAGNMDWLLLERVIASTPYLSWVFVGPTSMAIPAGDQHRARARVYQHPRTFFTGSRAYGELAVFARAFDVAVLPYLRCEPTYSGSSTRFYEHLAACRPMVATPGLEELTRKTPLLTLVSTSEETVQALDRLRACDFDDGLASARWLASREGTWQFRAKTVTSALETRWSRPQTRPELYERLSA